MFTANCKTFVASPPSFTDLEALSAFVMCSSGTTGTPKGVRISHAMALYGLTKWWYAPAGAIYFCTSSLFWITSPGGILITILFKSIRLIASHPMTIDRMLDIMVARRVTICLMASPWAYQMRARLASGRYDLTALKVVQCSGSAVAEHVKRELHSYFDGMVTMIYGLTEVSCAISLSHSMVTNSVGHLSAGIRVQIVAANGDRLGPGESGEIYLKMPIKLLVSEINGH